MRTQRRLFEHRDWIRDQDGMISLGRSLLVIEPRSVDELSMLVELFGRVLVICRLEQHEALVAGLRHRGWAPDLGHRLHEVSAQEVLEVSARHSLARDLPAGHELHVVDDATPRSRILGIQALHCAAGLDPLPEHFIRGSEDACRTFYLLAPDGGISGCGTAQDLGPAGPRRRGWSLGQNVCLGASLRGGGVGRLLIHHTDRIGLEAHGAQHVCSVVAHRVTPSASIGRELPCHHGVVFIDSQVRHDGPRTEPTARAHAWASNDHEERA